MRYATMMTATAGSILLTAASAFSQPTDDNGANLGRPAQVTPPLPAPAETDDSATKAPSEDKVGRKKAEPSLAQIAQRLIDERRYPEAIRAASLGIARQPEQAEQYRRIRSRAYALSGRYEEALADSKPLDLTVAAHQAALKSGNDVVATIKRGTQIKVTEVRGDWLKVSAADGQSYDWAWIWKGHVARPGAAPADAGRRAGRRPTVDVRVYADGYRYRRRYDHEPPRYYPPSPYAPYDDYGRLHYDWWQHVPPRYWEYLPR